MRWYRLAADQGFAYAQNWLGRMYAEGDGVPQDSAEAVRWYRLAADQGHADAQFALGVTYLFGDPRDTTEALRWYRLAADQGHANAQRNLAFMHAEGDGVRQDYVAAHMWLSLAAARALAAHRATVVEEQEALAEQMTSDQIAEAERLAREWKPAEQS